MPFVTFLEENIRVEVPQGASLLKVCEDVNSSVPFSCTIGTCRSCMIRIVSGKEHLSGKNERETYLLAGLPHNRLACQVYVFGDVTISRKQLTILEE